MSAFVRAKRLGIYLNDHLAGATLGVQLARRCRDANAGTPVGSFLSELAEEIAADRETLLAVMARVGIPVSRSKVAAAWTAERLGRLKLNGQLRGYSPLSRVVELEGLATGIEGKRCLWLSLAQLRDDGNRQLGEFDLDGLAARARDQRERLEPHRLAAAQLIA